MTLEEFGRLSPRARGYIDGSPEAEQFAEGQRAAVLTAQDAEE